MKLKLLLRIVAGISVVVALAITLNVNSSAQGSDLSDIALANIEALASSETGSGCKCGCTGPKKVCSDNETSVCSCENDVCCCDNSGCKE